MANAAVLADPRKIYLKTFSCMAASRGPSELSDICVAVGRGPSATRRALEALFRKRLVTLERDGRWRFAYSVREYGRLHYWKGPSYSWYLERPEEEMPTFKRMRFTCDVLGCVTGWFLFRHRRVLTVPEALAVLREMNNDLRLFFDRYAYGKLPRPVRPSPPPLRIADAVRAVEKMGDVWCKDWRKMPRCVELQRHHAFGSTKAYEFMREFDEDYKKLDRIKDYFYLV